MRTEAQASRRVQRGERGCGSKKKLGGFLFAKMVRGGAAELSSNAEAVNKLNVFPVPDGDTGDNMRLTVESGIRAIENLESDDLAEVMRTLSHGMLLGARGNSGVILSQFFSGVAEGFANASEADVRALGEALRLGVRRAYATVSTPTEGTILTVAREAVDYAVSKITARSTVKSFFGDLADEMHDSLERTPELLPSLKAAGVVDSGGAGLFYIIDGFRRVLNGEEPKAAPVAKNDAACRARALSELSAEELGCRYCTELLIQLFPRMKSTLDEGELRERLSRLGDSLATVLSDGILKVHIHTEKPDRILSFMHGYGEFLNIKIENMTVQELNNAEKSKSLFTDNGKNAPREQKKHSIIAVSFGEGISAAFRELGADGIILAEPGRSPSAKEFIDAFALVGGESITVLPNNANICLAAKQAADMYTAARVRVLNTTGVGMGYCALAAFDCEAADTDSAVRNVREQLSHVRDGYVSVAVKDTEFDGIKIKKGYALGIIDKRIALCKRSPALCAEQLAGMLLEGKGVLFLFYGAGVSEDEAQRLEDKIRKSSPKADVYCRFGGQKLHPYIFAAR